VEAFWVLDGEAEFELEGQLSRAGAGSFVLVPGDAPPSPEAELGLMRRHGMRPVA
jgi:quercetin dioxygenase-like cupin family protein